MKLTKEVELNIAEVNKAIIDYAQRVAGTMVDARIEWQHPKFADTFTVVKDFKVIIRG